MKKQLLFNIILAVLVIPALALGDVEINSANFPDDNFREYVKQYDTDENGFFSDEELGEVYGIYCDSMDLYDLTGIEHFNSLHYLGCTSNHLTNLDVSNNTKLWRLTCDDNQLTSLDVSKNTALTELYCGSNQLQSLDVSKNTALNVLGCYYNQLISLDVSKNTALTELDCSSNQLTDLDVSENTTLTRLNCSFNQLTSLNVSKNTALAFLKCLGNRLTSLDISGNPDLLNAIEGLEAKVSTYGRVYWGDDEWDSVIRMEDTVTLTGSDGRVLFQPPADAHDITGDGEVDGEDVVSLALGIVSGDTEDMMNADMNGDSKVDGRDVILLIRMLNN